MIRLEDRDLCTGRLVQDEACDAGNHSAHTDAPAFTLLWYPTDAGLDVKAHDGTWSRAIPPPGAMLLITGDLLHFASQGSATPTVHRPPLCLTKRPVLMLFVYPDSNAKIGPSSVPPCVALTTLEYSAWHTSGWQASAAVAEELGLNPGAKQDPS
eukprot:CAMPEP_0115679570 /NCGR_PEP_ID=MMETSP0272-20121206/56348_1 /TAXON_ID=71861 /ORGANISM="Scrippsiella trochoidea, Strain CCMP3099" /LENGTH=154 /DNA_ID=CAMNT_0003118801 /DNA_START=65 /DNA_END=526 /DNA_ORIENTATION=-